MSTLRKIIEIVLAFLGALLAAIKVAESAESVTGSDSPMIDDEGSSWF